ncbi:SulP family inorganic anion transporter [Novosphingobium flavum]|uniref:SulP family inorganic anion transporter n=2 Tax=Novosphingobium flavum TaxID=1778672 RepID=A0A7X1FSB8_9SPHN|nr:SulP family inorganic anion transporter [Novosphingobium flavum]MBC2666093.1 SulP family inorganic anion transporter [Novosphingobium flavum]
MNAAGAVQRGPFAHLARDFTASVVVFLVAMPLCMGIAIASGVPAEMGLVTGIIGGLVVGSLAGSPLQVSGPAAGLAVIVFEFVNQYGLAALFPVLVLVGAIQFAAGALKLGGVFRVISPAVVHGMLAGIGALIVLGQFHILFDARPLSSGLQNLAAIPGRITGISLDNPSQSELAIVLGLITMVVMVGWEKLRPARLALVPGALLGVAAATLLAFALKLDVTRVAVPESIAAAFRMPGADLFAPLADTALLPGLLISAVAMAFIASAETLLSAAAVDRMHDGERTEYNKELRAQGVGNLLCGLFGGLPMTGVIVRSSANVQAGARTRISTILHGAWILGFVALLPWLLREIPMAALGGVLVVTGWRLVKIDDVKHLLHQYGPLPAAIWAITFALVVSTDLLTGVLAGLALSLVELVPHRRGLNLKVAREHEGEATELKLEGAATFLGLVRLNSALDTIPDHHDVKLDLRSVHGIDHTTAQTLREWLSRRRSNGRQVELAGHSDVLKPLHA